MWQPCHFTEQGKNKVWGKDSKEKPASVGHPTWTWTRLCSQGWSAPKPKGHTSQHSEGFLYRYRSLRQRLALGGTESHVHAQEMISGTWIFNLKNDRDQVQRSASPSLSSTLLLQLPVIPSPNTCLLLNALSSEDHKDVQMKASCLFYPVSTEVGPMSSPHCQFLHQQMKCLRLRL